MAQGDAGGTWAGSPAPHLCLLVLRAPPPREDAGGGGSSAGEKHLRAA